MKKRIAVLMLGLMFVLSACGGSTKVIEGEVATTSQQEESLEQTEDTSVEADESEEKGYVFTYNDVAMAVDADASQVVEKLGEPDSYFEYASCAFEGLDKVYTYGSFEVNTYPMEDKDCISTIIFKDDMITTKEGVGIGDSVDKMKEIYGEATEENTGMYVYEKDNMKLNFIVQDDVIVSVEYCSTVLDEN